MTIQNDHMTDCSGCKTCIDVCPRYTDPDSIQHLYDFLNGIVQTPHIDLKRCLTCGLCTEACPEKLGVKKLILASRQKANRDAGSSPGRNLSDPFSKNNIFKRFSQYRKPCTFKREGADAEVLFFPGCSGTHFFSGISRAMEALLENAGIDYSVMSGSDSCCGAVSAGIGDTHVLETSALRNVKEMKKRGIKTIVTTCPACFMAFKSIYPVVMEMDFEIYQAAPYLEKLVGEQKLTLGRAISKVFYHDPCHLARGMGIYNEPRNLLKGISGTELMNSTPKGSGCCGLGGGVRRNFPADSLSLAKERHKAAKTLGCDLIITNCPGCYQNLLETRSRSGPEVMDLAEYIAVSKGMEPLHSKKEDRETIQWINREFQDKS